MTAGKSALSAVHAAVYGVLSADATLGTLAPGGVWDHVPQDQAVWPYVRVGSVDEVPDDTAGRQGRKVTFTVHVWSQYRGLKEVYALVDRVMALLRYTSLTLGASWAHGDTRHMSSAVDEPTVDDGGVQIQHATVEFDVLVQEVL
jgi:hypothetical protein